MSPNIRDEVLLVVDFASGLFPGLAFVLRKEHDLFRAKMLLKASGMNLEGSVEPLKLLKVLH